MIMHFIFQVLIPLMTALAAGNTVVIKPSEMSANTSLVVEKLCNKYLDRSAVLWVRRRENWEGKARRMVFNFLSVPSFFFFFLFFL